MACCAEGSDCPMHQAESRHSGLDHMLTQVEADTCCVSSEREDSTPSTPTFVAALSLDVLGPGIVVPMTVPSLVLSDEWRTVLPAPTKPIPRHVLLSVFVV